MKEISSNKYQLVASMLAMGFIAAMPVRAISLRDMNIKIKRQYVEQKKKYVETGSIYEKTKEDYLEAREILRQERGEDLRQAKLDKVKNYFSRVGTGMIKYLELVKAKVEKTKGLSEDQKTELITKIDEEISWIKSKQEEVKQVETREELRSLAKEVREHWRETRKKIHNIVGRLMGYRLNQVIERMERVGDKVEVVIENLATQDKDVAELKKEYSVYESELVQAKKLYGEIKGSYSLEGSLGERLREVNQHLRKAYQSLREVVKLIREMK